MNRVNDISLRPRRWSCRVAITAFAISICGAINPPSCAAQETITIARDGKVKYSIFLDPLAPSSVKTAAEDLQSYIAKVTGFSPRVISAGQPPTGPFISLGSTSAAKAERLDAATLPPKHASPHDGFRIVTRGSNLFILGPDTADGQVTAAGGPSTGTANGVYTFIEDYLGVHWLMPGETGEEYTPRDSVEVPGLDRIEVPPMNYRVIGYLGSRPHGLAWQRRLKQAKVSNVQHSHAWAHTIPPTLYDQHPDWFALVDGKRVPPSGRYKLETTNPEMVQAYADAVIAAFRQDPNRRWYSLSPADGGFGWSESPETRALLETDKHGKVSRTKLVLKFYNDVARIVGREFPDRKLAGYIYSSYLYPPAEGLPKIEPNLALVLATSISYGFKLYRPEVEEDWDELMRAWGESAKRNGFDVYYYDLPVGLAQSGGIVLPAAPGILNFIYSRLSRYGYKGAYLESNTLWPSYGVANYVNAKLMWNPTLDAATLQKTYYRQAYGTQAAPHIEKIYTLLDTAFSEFYRRNLRASYTLTPSHLTEVYGPLYPQLDAEYLLAQQKAQQERVGPRQRHRLELFGQVMSLMQWNLRANGLLSAAYQSPLTRTDEQIDAMLAHSDPDQPIVRISSTATAEGPLKVTMASALETVRLPAAPQVHLRGDVRLLLHAPVNGEVKVTCTDFDGQAEFVRFILSDVLGQRLQTGVMRAGRIIRFTATAGQSYVLDIPSRSASLQLQVQGAAAAYKANRHDTGFRVNADRIDGAVLPLYFFVPEGTGSFYVTQNQDKAGILTDVISPSGEVVGQLGVGNAADSRVSVAAGASREGFWKLVTRKPASANRQIVTFTLADKLPQWFSTDPAQSLQITAAN
jgi:hypothetical protein